MENKEFEKMVDEIVEMCDDYFASEYDDEDAEDASIMMDIVNSAVTDYLNDNDMYDDDLYDELVEAVSDNWDTEF